MPLTTEKRVESMPSQKPKPSLLLESFRVGISLKGLHALIESVGGILLLTIPPETINRLLMAVLEPELSRNPHDFVARWLLHVATHVAGSGQNFAAWYLISHGVVKLVLVIALLRNRLWAYPLMIAMLGTFICYQSYRFALTRSLWMVLLTIFDLVVLVLTWLEYGEQRALAQQPRNA